MLRLGLIMLCVVGLCGAYAQNTLGLLSYDASKAYDGYNLIYPHNQPSVFLLDNCGEIVHEWTDEANFVTGNWAYLLEDGRLVKAKRDITFADDPIWAGGGGETIEIRDWDNNLEWSFTLNDSTARLHHDIEPMPNGNILAIVWEYRSREEAIEAGRDTSLLDTEIWPDYIIEIDPSTDEVVWEWHAWDHLIQDYDSTKSNYGTVSDHPELIDINFDDNSNPDWMHSNAIDYDATNDLIMLSVPFFNEVMVIDHSTSTEEAAGHTGGNSGVGGDLMWRWGNNASYKSQDTLQQLFGQHDTRWIDEPWISPADPNYGKVLVFNNNIEADASEVNLIANTYDMYSSRFGFDEDRFLPFDYDKRIRHPEPTKMWSTGLSSAQYLPNGNYLICVGRFGYLFELTPDDEVVWEYITPLRRGFALEQGDTTLEINNNLTFRAQRYPVDYGAFQGRDLEGGEWIELNPDTAYCDFLTATVELGKDFQISLSPNPADNVLTMEWEAGKYVTIEVLDIHGRQMVTPMKLSGGRYYQDVSLWQDGLYFVRLNDVKTVKCLIQH